MDRTAHLRKIVFTFPALQVFMCEKGGKIITSKSAYNEFSAPASSDEHGCEDTNGREVKSIFFGFELHFEFLWAKLEHREISDYKVAE